MCNCEGKRVFDPKTGFSLLNLPYKLQFNIKSETT
jgi:hypothetical protein